MKKDSTCILLSFRFFDNVEGEENFLATLSNTWPEIQELRELQRIEPRTRELQQQRQQKEKITIQN